MAFAGLAAAYALTAFAQTATTTVNTSADAAAKIACVGTAVNAREQSLDYGYDRLHSISEFRVQRENNSPAAGLRPNNLSGC